MPARLLPARRAANRRDTRATLEQLCTFRLGTPVTAAGVKSRPLQPMPRDFSDIRCARALHYLRAMLRTALLISLAAGLAACDVGSVLGPGGGGAQPDAGGGGGGGDSGGGGGGTARLTVTLTSSPSPQPTYQPANVLSVWVTDSNNKIMKTINRYSDLRTGSLVAWGQAAGTNDVDAISGATRTSHTGAVTSMWDCTNRTGQVIPDGTYTVHMEVADTNAISATQNNEGTFTFVKGPQPQMQTGLSNGGFTNVSINFTP